MNRPARTYHNSERGFAEVRALIFDVFGTLVDWRSGISAAFRSKLGERAPAGALADAWRSRYLPSMDRVRNGELPWTNLDELHAKSLEDVLSAFNLTNIDADVRAALVQSWHSLPAWPDTVAGLWLLKRHRTIAALSNGNMSLLVELSKSAGLPWDVIFSAELFRHFKPDREVYEGAVGMLGLKAEQVMMVASHVDDLAAARACGLRTAYVYRPLERGSHVRLSPREDLESDLTVVSLPELAEALDVGVGLERVGES